MIKIMKTHSILLFLLTLTVFTPSYADSPHLSQDLVYLNNPIDPVCISDPERQATDNNNLIDLIKCGMAQSHYVADGQNDYLAEHGYYGWEWKDTSDPSVSTRGSSYYKTWDAGDHKYWVVDRYNGGGSGYFSTLSLLSRKDYHTIQLVALSGGDRCNGGIDEVIPKGNKLEYSVHITPSDLLGIAEGDSNDSKTPEDVSSCASCCTATAFFKVDRKGVSEFLYVDLSTRPKDNVVDDEGSYQGCFDGVVSSYLAKGVTKLDDKELREFVRRFHLRCVQK